ncbi:50S ribosomal protein L9 [Candidatus Parcubacteria bacterium]|nr:MAG: 50S ribosomal protein L9 [Candidatus Parcubacteria bacterium]
MRKIMKVILLKNVEKLGQEGDIVEVSFGYFRNFLEPNCIAKKADSKIIAEARIKKEKIQKEAEMDLAKTQELAHKLDGQVIEIKARASEEGTLFAGISPAKVAGALKEKGFDISKNQIRAEHIKELGEFEITVNLAHGLESRVILTVTKLEEK